MTADHDCRHDWCIAPHDPMCDCPYSNAQPHKRDGCKYARDDDQDHDELMTADADPVVVTVACACRLGSHQITVPPSTLIDGGTVTYYCAATGQLFYAHVDGTTPHLPNDQDDDPRQHHAR